MMNKIKRCLLGLVFVVGFATMVQAATPVYVICGTYAIDGNQPTVFLVSIDGAAAKTVAPTQYNGKVRVHYNIAGITPGTHTVTVAAQNM